MDKKIENKIYEYAELVDTSLSSFLKKCYEDEEVYYYMREISEMLEDSGLMEQDDMIYGACRYVDFIKGMKDILGLYIPPLRNHGEDAVRAGRKTGKLYKNLSNKPWDTLYEYCDRLNKEATEDVNACKHSASLSDKYLVLKDDVDYYIEQDCEDVIQDYIPSKWKKLLGEKDYNKIIDTLTKDEKYAKLLK